MQERLSGRDCCHPCQHSKAYLPYLLGARPPQSDVACYEDILIQLGSAFLQSRTTRKWNWISLEPLHDFSVAC
jgi:hypothetical protein